jgi:hypothetical protein
MKAAVLSLLGAAVLWIGLSFTTLPFWAVAGSGIIGFIVLYLGVTVMTSSGPSVATSTTTEAIEEARARLSRIATCAIQAKSTRLVQEASKLSDGYEQVFKKMLASRNGYTQFGLTLELLRLLVEAAEECVRHKNDSTRFGEMREKLEEAFNDALSELAEKSEGIDAQALRTFETKCATVRTITAEN